MPSHWGLSFNIWIWGELKHFVYSWDCSDLSLSLSVCLLCHLSTRSVSWLRDDREGGQTSYIWHHFHYVDLLKQEQVYSWSRHCRLHLLMEEGQRYRPAYGKGMHDCCGRMQSPFSSVQFSSVAQSCRTLCDPVNHSTPGLPVHHQLPEFTLTHVHWVSDAIQPSHPLSSPSPPASNPSQHQGLFKWVNSSHEVTKVLEFQLQHQSFQWTLGTDLLHDGLVGSPCSPRDSQESSPTTQFKSTNFSALSFLHSPTLTSIHDHWKNHSLD